MSGCWAAAMRGTVAAAAIALCIGGAGMIAQGIAVPLKAEVAQSQLEQVFEQRLAVAAGTDAKKPPVAVASPTEVEPRISPKGAALPATGPVARLSVQRLGVKETILAGDATHDHLAHGPVLLKQGDSDNPVTILAAHRDTHFLFIRDLREGDEVSLQFVTGETARYRVTGFETVRWDEFTYPLDPARPLLALTTCYPFGGTEYGGPLRRVAWAVRVV